jgi:hypothetical protein
MKKITNYFLAALLSMMIVNVYGQENEDSRPPREKWSEVSTRGTVTAVAKDTREITLMASDGNLVTVVASEAVERFDEIAIDDEILFEYLTYMKAEFREPTAEELAEPIVVLAEAGKAPEGMDPEAMVGAIVKAVVSIEVLNRPLMLATIQGPGGNYMTFQMEDEELMKELHIGQIIIFTYAEAIIVSLDKVNSEN